VDLHRLALLFALLLVGCAQPAVSSCRADKATKLGAFELFVLGSGGPGAFGRGGSSYLVVVDGAPRVLVDAGPGAFVRLGELGFDLATLDTILLTHLHIDHAGDIPGVVKARDVSSNDPQSFFVLGPTGHGPYPATSAFVDRLFGASGAFAYLPAFRNPLKLDVTDLPIAPEAPIWKTTRPGDLTISAVAVDHDDAPAVAFRVEHGGRAIVVSGDLASKNDNLVHLAANADVLVYDTSVVDPPGSPSKLYDLHTAPHRIGEVAAAARVHQLVLGHVTPAVFAARDAVLQSVAATYRGPTRFATDCLRLPLL
jgi:ribonuclease BN (tRNA processing enzyme)